MRLAVIIVTAGRREILSLTLARLGQQTRCPDLLIVSAPDNSHVDPAAVTALPIRYVFGGRGCTAQRNRALDSEAARTADVIVFFDDDFVPAPDYLQAVEAAFAAHPEWAVLTGHVLADGVTGPGISFPDACRLLAEAAPGVPERHDVIAAAGAYGCNMAFRAADIGTLRFDERLPLYGWQEDTDFSRRVAGGRPIVRCHGLRGVHLGVKGARLSGVRFGYSQVANPIYLVGKKVSPPGWALGLICRNMVANAAGSLRPEPHVDRLGRLRGNALALLDLASGRMKPENILKL